MRTHGWSGSPPTSDEEAVARILDAAQEGIERLGRDLRISDVARTLGVTRQTVYRYFPSTEELLVATALRATGPFLERVRRRLRAQTEPAGAVVTAMVLVIRELPDNPCLSVALFPKGPEAGLGEVTSPVARTLGVGMLESLEVDWRAAGFDDDRLAELVEHMLRLLQSFLLDGPEARRSARELTAYLDRWLRPAIQEIAGNRV